MARFPIRLAGLLLTGLIAGMAACAPASSRGGAASGSPAASSGQGSAGTAEKVSYLGIETHLLQTDLVEFRVALSGGRGPEPVTDYATCAAAQYALIRGYGFARHVRTKLSRSGSLWRANAAYLISRERPSGQKVIAAQSVVAACKARGIPTV